MRLFRLFLVASVAVSAVGCGSPLLKTRGRVLKGGSPFLAKQGEFVRVTFVPVTVTGPADAYVAEVDRATGEFHVAGKDGKGMPPGRYRVSVELDKRRSDLLRGKFGQDKSPFVFDVDANTKEIVIDLDQPPKG